MPAGAIQDHVKAHGTLKIQRRWVERGLPASELLEALAIAYGRMAELVHDAHRQMGLDPSKTVRDDTGERYDIAALGWRMPCMVGHDQPRTLLLSLADGSRISFDNECREVDLKDAERSSTERYGATAVDALRQAFSGSPADIARNLFNCARTAFLRDGYHTPFLFLLKGDKLVKIFVTPVENRAQKYLQMRRLATEAIRHGATAAISIGEAWMAPLAELSGYQSPSEVPMRKEALALVLACKTGEPVQYLAMIQRDNMNVTLSETVVNRGLPGWEFAPFYQAWGRPIPDDWRGGFHDGGSAPPS
jgi:hypothetical protein